MAVTYMTEEGLQKLKEELHFLETVERPRVIAAIAEAREKGDLSENAEYDAAKEEQGVLESKIAHIKAKLMDARVLDTKDIQTDEVQILTKVRVRVLKTGKEKTETKSVKGVYILVGNEILFKQIVPLYTGEGFIICMQNPKDEDLVTDEIGVLKAYDEVVVEGANLYDGKIIDRTSS